MTETKRVPRLRGSACTCRRWRTDKGEQLPEEEPRTQVNRHAYAPCLQTHAAL
jgi:hypothetical protein